MTPVDAGFLAGAHPASGGVWRGDAAGGTVATKARDIALSSDMESGPS